MSMKKEWLLLAAVAMVVLKPFGRVTQLFHAWQNDIASTDELERVLGLPNVVLIHARGEDLMPLPRCSVRKLTTVVDRRGKKETRTRGRRRYRVRCSCQCRGRRKTLPPKQLSGAR